MARGAESIIRFVDATLAPPTTVDRTTTFLQRPRCDLWPLSGKGGGKAAVHVEPHHLVNLILGLAADQPSGAEAAVRLLRDTYASAPLRSGMDDPFLDKVLQLVPPPSLEDWNGTEPGEEKISAGAWLDTMTRRLASLLRQEQEEFAQVGKVASAEIAMCVAPASVVLSWIGPDQRREEVRFSSLDTPLGDLFASPSNRITAPRRRLTAFPVAILAVAAELAADTWNRRAADLPFPPSGSNPESENAPSLPGPGASTRTNQPRDQHAAGHYYTPETKRVCANYQAPRGPFPQLKEPRSYATRP